MKNRIRCVSIVCLALTVVGFGQINPYEKKQPPPRVVPQPQPREVPQEVECEGFDGKLTSLNFGKIEDIVNDA